ncbi:MAG: nitrogen regulation protein NR(II), partial [Mariprofundus sp.]
MADKSRSVDVRHAILAMDPLQLSLLVAMPFVLMFSLTNFFQQLYGLAQIELLMVLTLAGLYGWTRKVDMPFWQKNLFIIHPALLFSLLFLQGGYSEIGFIWSFGFPFIACLSAGCRIGLAWTVLYALIIAALSTLYGDMAWQTLTYIGLAYAAFSLIAVYTVLWREKNEESQQYRLAETTKDLKHGEHLLADHKIAHRTLLDALPHALAVHCEGRWIYCNPAAALLLGVDGPEEIIGSPILDYLHSDEHEQVRQRIEQMAISGRPAPVMEEQLLRKNGDAFLARVQSSPILHEGKAAFLVTAEDVSERKEQDVEHHQLKSQLEHSQRLESLGVLAGGIAHDFNNLLAAILGNAELAKGKLDDKAAVMDHINNIVGSCDHAAELCKQMLAYAGKGSYELGVLNLNDMVKSMGKLIRASVSSNIALKIKLDSDLPGIECDRAQIQQLVLNFIVNSADAIGGGAGEIKVSTGVRNQQREQLDKLYNGSDLPEGQYVIVEVRDSGCGMSPDMQAKIFDPFFTTKETGSGLGLSAVLGIVRGHQGAIQVFSSPGKGTAFRVYFPSTDQAVKEKMVSTVE